MYLLHTKIAQREQLSLANLFGLAWLPLCCCSWLYTIHKPLSLSGWFEPGVNVCVPLSFSCSAFRCSLRIRSTTPSTAATCSGSHRAVTMAAASSRRRRRRPTATCHPTLHRRHWTPQRRGPTALLSPRARQTVYDLFSELLDGRRDDVRDAGHIPHRSYHDWRRSGRIIAHRTGSIASLMKQTCRAHGTLAASSF